MPRNFFGASGDASSSFVNLEKVEFLLHTYTPARTSHYETQKPMAGFLWLSDVA
ncbi:hypothetical protein B0813_002611 [Candidatus Fervidibacteria bacterium JGI MDM2 SSWTFF-3-K9]